MTNAKTIIGIALFMMLMVVLVDSLGLTSTNEIVVPGTTGETEGPLRQIWSFVVTFYSIMTFQLVGVPALVNLFIFTPLAFGVIYIIVNILKDVVPFT